MSGKAVTCPARSLTSSCKPRGLSSISPTLRVPQGENGITKTLLKPPQIFLTLQKTEVSPVVRNSYFQLYVLAGLLFRHLSVVPNWPAPACRKSCLTVFGERSVNATWEKALCFFFFFFISVLKMEQLLEVFQKQELSEPIPYVWFCGQSKTCYVQVVVSHLRSHSLPSSHFPKGPLWVFKQPQF